MRHRCLEHLVAHRAEFEPFITNGNFDTYVNSIHTGKIWAGHVELQCIAAVYNVQIEIHQGPPMVPFTVSSDGPGSVRKVLRLCYTNGSHYDVLLPRREMQVHTDCQGGSFLLLLRINGSHGSLGMVYDVLESAIGCSRPPSGTYVPIDKHLHVLELKRKEHQSQRFVQVLISLLRKQATVGGGVPTSSGARPIGFRLHNKQRPQSRDVLLGVVRSENG